MTGRRDSLRSEDGIAMVVAMGVLAVMMVLGATLVMTTSVLGTATKTDGLRKSAFEAAQAGLQATVYRMNMLTPDNTLCIGGPGGSITAVDALLDGWCPANHGEMGNATTYDAYTTPVLSALDGGKCAGLQVGVTANVIERCVTSTGTVGGVTRRVQARIGSYAGARLFPFAGLIALHSVDIDNNGTINGVIGSNGQVTLGNKVQPSGIVLGPSAPDLNAFKGLIHQPTRRTATEGPFTLAPVDPGDTATSADGNVRLSNAQQGVSPADAIGSGATWNPATRSLTLNNNATVVLGGAKYNFCNLTLDNNSSLQLAVGARTAIYVDSPDRPGSGCPAGSGQFSMSNGARVVNTAAPAPGATYPDPTALQVFVYGSGSSTVTLANGANFYGTLYAPRSRVYMAPSNNSQVVGAVAAMDITMRNVATFTGDPGAAGIETPNAAKLYFVTSWRECRATPDDPDKPGSGC